ncbi:hypothetical protein A2U01_0064501, partial [Trifolium medium]|nr:hypothetical protein [Trifolium medium]
ARRAGVACVARSNVAVVLFFLLLVVRRTGVVCAARRVVLLRAFWLLVPALHAG